MKFTKGTKVWRTVYNLSGKNITNVDQQLYLGVTFDRKLTFGAYTRELGAKSLRLATASARLAKYIGNRKLNMTFYNLYNLPLISYASFIWDKSKITVQKEVDRGHHRATIAALSSACRPHIAGYIPYLSRCEQLKTTPAHLIRRQQHAALAAKILAGHTNSNLLTDLQTALFVPRENDRRVRTIFDQRSPLILNKTSIGRIALELETLGKSINFQSDSILTIKSKTKKALYEEYLPYMLPPITTQQRTS